MKKLLLGALLLLSISTFAQDSFVRKYTWYTQKINTKQVSCSATVIYNYNGTNDVVLYTGAKTIHLVKISSVDTGANRVGEKFQQIECVDQSDGFPVSVQLFDKDKAVRFIIGNDYIEYHE